MTTGINCKCSKKKKKKIKLLYFVVCWGEHSVLREGVHVKNLVSVDSSISYFYLVWWLLSYCLTQNSVLSPMLQLYILLCVIISVLWFSWCIWRDNCFISFSVLYCRYLLQLCTSRLILGSHWLTRSFTQCLFSFWIVFSGLCVFLFLHWFFSWKSFGSSVLWMFSGEIIDHKNNWRWHYFS